MELKKLLAFANLFHQHAKGCRKDPFRCKTCKCAVKFFEELPPSTLSMVLEDHGPCRTYHFPAPPAAAGVSA